VCVSTSIFVMCVYGTCIVEFPLYSNGIVVMCEFRTGIFVACVYGTGMVLVPVYIRVIFVLCDYGFGIVVDYVLLWSFCRVPVFFVVLMYSTGYVVLCVYMCRYYCGPCVQNSYCVVCVIKTCCYGSCVQYR